MKQDSPEGPAETALTNPEVKYRPNGFPQFERYFNLKSKRQLGVDFFQVEPDKMVPIIFTDRLSIESDSNPVELPADIRYSPEFVFEDTTIPKWAHTADFLKLLQKYGFDSAEMISISQAVQKCAGEIPISLQEVEWAGAFALGSGFKSKNRDGGLSPAENSRSSDFAFQNFRKLVANLALTFRKFRPVLEKADVIFGDTEALAAQCEAFLKLIDQAKLITKEDGYYIHFDGPIVEGIPPFDDTKIEGKGFNPINSEVKRFFIEKIGANAMCQMIILYAQFFAAIKYIAVADAKITSRYQKVFADASRDVISMKGLMHPIHSSGPGDLHRWTHNTKLFEHLVAAGVVQVTGSTYRPTASNEEIAKAYDTFHEDGIDYNKAQFLKSCGPDYVPNDIDITPEERILIVSGKNSAGKSSFMSGVKGNAELAKVGRRVHAVKAQIGEFDQIFTDKIVGESLGDGISRFRAQVRAVGIILEKATPKSIILLDELYHGTSPLYMTSLSLATIEEFVRRNLRAIITTHDHVLTHAIESGNYTSLKGYFAPRKPETEFTGTELLPIRKGVRNLSVGHDHKVVPGATYDSDALAIAVKEKLPESLIARAWELIEIMTK